MIFSALFFRDFVHTHAPMVPQLQSLHCTMYRPLFTEGRGNSSREHTLEVNMWRWACKSNQSPHNTRNLKLSACCGRWLCPWLDSTGHGRGCCQWPTRHRPRAVTRRTVGRSLPAGQAGRRQWVLGATGHGCTIARVCGGMRVQCRG